MHELIRRHSLAAWDATERGEPNPLADRLTTDPTVLAVLASEQVRALLNAGDYVGDAPQRARELAALIRGELSH